MKRLIGASAAALMAASAPAQTGAMQAESRTVVTPVTPPTTMMVPVDPNTFVVTPVPGVVAATRVKVQNFTDYDRNRDGAYNPMEFAQAIYFLATTDPVAGNPKLPAWDRYMHRGAPERMRPGDAVTLLNATADEFGVVDLDNDWRVTPDELAAVALM